MTALTRLLIVLCVSLPCACEAPEQKPTQPHDTPGVSYDEVKKAISDAKPGDTVIVPSGSATWDRQLIITKGIRLIAKTPGGVTITGNYRAPNLGNNNNIANYLIVYMPTDPSLDSGFRLSGFILDGGGKCLLFAFYNLTSSPTRKNRVDHNIFRNSAGRLMYSVGSTFGVIDNNEFHGGGPITGSNGGGDLAWHSLTYEFGTEENLYYEDNSFFMTDTAFDGGGAGRYAVRHNSFHYSNQSKGLYPCFDMHGNSAVTNPSGFGVEIYENTIYIESPGIGMTIFDQRGGRGLLFNNNVISNSTVTSKAQEEHLDSDNPPATSPIDGRPQHVHQSYYWGNRKNGTRQIDSYYIGTQLDYGGDIGLVPRENRDVWWEKGAFDGSSGVGIGLLAERPVNCNQGVAYWATDTRTLYRCIAPNVWETYYTPYTYPHPLRNRT
jgi:hypothetical protein